jgi:hypothetical protein
MENMGFGELFGQISAEVSLDGDPSVASVSDRMKDAFADVAQRAFARSVYVARRVGGPDPCEVGLESSARPNGVHVEPVTASARDALADALRSHKCSGIELHTAPYGSSIGTPNPQEVGRVAVDSDGTPHPIFHTSKSLGMTTAGVLSLAVANGRNTLGERWPASHVWGFGSGPDRVGVVDVADVEDASDIDDGMGTVNFANATNTYLFPTIAHTAQHLFTTMDVTVDMRIGGSMNAFPYQLMAGSFGPLGLVGVLGVAFLTVRAPSFRGGISTVTVPKTFVLATSTSSGEWPLVPLVREFSMSTTVGLPRGAQISSISVSAGLAAFKAGFGDSGGFSGVDLRLPNIPEGFLGETNQNPLFWFQLATGPIAIESIGLSFCPLHVDKRAV